jgi:uncharacterized protein YaiI (UPF0178 family)
MAGTSPAMTVGGQSEKVRSVRPISVYIDVDACPVKQEIYRVAERHALKGTALKVSVVSSSPVAAPRVEMIERAERV